MNKQWQADLAPLGTDWHKEFLETCPFLIMYVVHGAVLLLRSVMVMDYRLARGEWLGGALPNRRQIV